jgi:hypothetical protein
MSDIILTGEVIDTSIAFKPSTDSNNKQLPLGTVKVACFASTQKTAPRIVNASPYDTTNIRVPLKGERVLIFYLAQDFSSTTFSSDKYYYLNPVNIQGDVNTNALPGQKNLSATGKVANSYSTTINTPNIVIGNAAFTLGSTFKQATIKHIQPFEGDAYLQGRFGQSIRFGSTVLGDTSIYSKSPNWTGTRNGDPITIISNGHAVDSSKTISFTIEDINKDKSSIYLTSNQKLGSLQSSQKNIGLGVKPASIFTGAQIVITSDRILLNSKQDYVILSGKKGVNVATPKWAMDMDKLFTTLESLIQELANLTSGTAFFATGVGPTGPATNVAQIQKLLVDIKTMKQ